MNADGLHSALQTNLGISPIDKSIMNDIIERLAYVNNEELVLSDMIFFEPTDEDDVYTTYRRNISKAQDPKDRTWYGAYKNLWKALINTVKVRRIIQTDMFSLHPKAVDMMFDFCGKRKSEKFDAGELLKFIKDQGILSFDSEMSTFLIKALDRDQDNMAAYEELYDAIYGAE